MDPMAEEHIDFGDEDYGGAQKMQYQGAGAIPALADEELMGEDDEYDDLYNDVNVGEGFLQLQRPEAATQPSGTPSSGPQDQKNDGPEQRVEAGVSQGLNIPGGLLQGKYPNAGAHFSEQKEEQPVMKRPEMGSVNYQSVSSVSQKGNVVGTSHETQGGNIGFQGLKSVPPKAGVDPSDVPQKIASGPRPINSGIVGSQGPPQIPANQMGADVNHPVVNEHQIRPSVENGSTMLYIGELHWWTTDAEIESACLQYGRVKEIKFFDERASGKSKGYCQVEFFDAAAAAACKEGMDGHSFNGRACVVAFASPQTMKQMAASYANKTQGQAQSQPDGKRPNDGMGRGGNVNYQSGDAGRNYGRGGWGRGGQVPNRPGAGGHMRGRVVGAKNMIGNFSGIGNGAGAGAYGQGPAGPAFGGPGGMMHPPGMMGAGFDPTYMGRGAGYGGFPGPGFPGMLPSFPSVNTMGLAGVAPHVNPAFFGRGMTPNGMGMMGSSVMEGPHAGMWTDTSMGGWGGDEHDHRLRESSYGGEDNVSEYGYGEETQEKGRSGASTREKERASEREWSGNVDRRQRDDREQDWDRSEREHREHRHREEKDGYHDHRRRERDRDHEDDWDRGQSSSRSRSKSRAMPQDERRSRSRDVDYGKRRRLPSE